MKLITIRYLFEYAVLIVPLTFIRILPHRGVRLFARMTGAVMYAIPSMRRLVRANIDTALPEFPAERRRWIARESFRHMALNMIEFLWMEGKPERIRRCYPAMPPEVYERIAGHRDRGERMIFVNPHIGSWEGSGLAVPFHGKTPVSVVTKPLENPFLNKLYNRWRKEVGGLRVIFSRGAVKASLAALKEGDSIGILIDQNTKVRDGGEFVDFFGLPVAGSTAPAMFKRYCDAHDVPVVILFGSSIRVGEDEHLTTICRPLPKAFDEYADDREVIQDLLAMTEDVIREYPEQYLWLYKRFIYIPEWVTGELRQRYPYYAGAPGRTFYGRRNAATHPRLHRDGAKQSF